MDTWSDTGDDTDPLGSGEEEEEEEDIGENMEAGGAPTREEEWPGLEGFISARRLLSFINGQYPQSCIPSLEPRTAGASPSQTKSTSMQGTHMTL